MLLLGGHPASSNGDRDALPRSGHRDAPNCEDFIPIWFGILKAGAVMSSINTTHKGDFLSWTINLVEARKLIVSDELLDRLDLIKGELPTLEHVIVWESASARVPTRALPTSPWPPS
jgi:carnitine-CoA ligase